MSIYQSIYNLIQTYIYGGSFASGSPEELVTVLLATIACVFMFALPFLVVWRIITVLL